MVLITTIAHNIVVSFDKVVNEHVEINIEGDALNQHLKISGTEFIKIPIEKGKYRVTVKESNNICSKTVFVF